MAPEPIAHCDRFDRLAGAAGLGLMLGMAALILYAPAPWFHDLSEWLFQARVLALKLIDPESVRAYVVAPYPVPSALGLALLAVLAAVLPLVWAGKLYVLLGLAGWVALVRVWTGTRVPVSHRGAVSAVLYALFALSSFFWYGFINYQLGLLLLLLFLLRHSAGMSLREQAAWGVLLFFCHAMVMLVWAWMVLARPLLDALRAEAWSRRIHVLWRAALPLWPAFALGLWYLVGRFSTDFPAMAVQAVMAGWGEVLLYKLGYPLMLGGFRNVMAADGQAVFEAWPWLYALGVASNVAVILLLGLWSLGVMRAAFTPLRAPVDAQHATRWLQLAGLVAICVLAPYHLFGLINPTGRLLLPLIALALLYAPAASLRWWRWAALPALCGGLLSLLGYAMLVVSLPAGQVDHPMPFRAEQAPSNSVFAFNAALHAGSRYRYFNYRVLALSERLLQAEQGRFEELRNTTSLLVDYRPDAVQAR